MKLEWSMHLDFDRILDVEATPTTNNKNLRKDKHHEED